MDRPQRARGPAPDIYTQSNIDFVMVFDNF